MSELQPILGDYQAFIATVLTETQQAGFDLYDFSQMDHICYRTSSLDNYHAKQEQLQSIARFLGEATVNHRPISTYRLEEPIVHDGWRIDCVELPAPKPHIKTIEGLEHAEFVLYDALEDFLKKYVGRSFELKSAQRGINPEVGLHLPNCSVKFHLLSLPAVVYIENVVGITEIQDPK